MFQVEVQNKGVVGAVSPEVGLFVLGKKLSSISFIGGLDAGKTWTFVFKQNFVDAFSPVFYADAENKIAESDELNNMFEKKEKVNCDIKKRG